MRIVVVGAGPGGIGAAAPLAAAGHSVTVLDRDPAPPDSDEEAWASWQRRSVPQTRQPHFFLARLWKEMAETAPELRAELEACDPAVLPFVDRLPPTASDRDPLPGDDELVAMGFRRPTFERGLRRWLTRQANLELRCGVEVTGLVAEPTATVPRVRGVALADGTTIDADLVVLATGRHGPAPRWLTEIGAGAVEEEVADGGLAYFSRYYRMAPGATPPPQYGTLVSDAGSIHVFTFPADHGTFTLAATPLADDKAMRGLKDNAAFDRVMRTIPRTAAWLDDTGAVPINDVGVLARIEDRRRRMVVDGRPAALGVVLCADAALCTNPVLGRGTSMAWIAGRRLAESLAEHGDDLEKLALAFDETVERELRPWYDDSLAQDRQRFAIMRTIASGEARPEPDPSDIGATMGAAMQFAGAHDGIVFRAGARRFNLLDPLDAIMSNGDAIARAIAIWERRAELPAPPPMPSRDELLAALAG
jgi:2-polyprenyl-6-methoxyphenol hydroxylase-like FAD-dependent oxidoreductase